MTQAHDKHGKEVHVGDVVEFVFAGEHHTGAVTKLREEHGHHYAYTSILIEIPTTASSRRDDENPKSAPREGTKPAHHNPKGTK